MSKQGLDALLESMGSNPEEAETINGLLVGRDAEQAPEIMAARGRELGFDVERQDVLDALAKVAREAAAAGDLSDDELGAVAGGFGTWSTPPLYGGPGHIPFPGITWPSS